MDMWWLKHVAGSVLRCLYDIIAPTRQLQVSANISLQCQLRDIGTLEQGMCCSKN